MANARYRPGADKTPLRRDGRGRTLCRWCGRPVPPPKQTFCSAECVHQWKLRTSGTYLRDALFKRDQGVCAQCGADTESMKIALRLARRESPERYHAVRETFRLTEAEALKSLWHADHIVEVADGGGACGLENLQILCWKCHKAKTADQRRARAALRRGKGS